MANFLINFCSTILMYLRIFKRRFLSIIGRGQQRRNTPPLLPQTVKHSTAPSSKDEDWENWTNDAKQEMTSVKITNPDEFIEERKIDNLFAAMAPVPQVAKAPVVAAPKKPELQPPPPSSIAIPVSSRFAVSDSFSAKAAELDDWVEDADNAWEQEDLDDRDIAAIEKRRLAAERREKRARESKAKETTTKETRGKLGTRA